jgi:hypothetical protein
MKTAASFPGTSDAFAFKHLLIVCGILASLLYVAMNIFVAMRYPGYSSATYTVSELSAIGAPTRPLWTSWAFVYTSLMMAFGWGVIKIANDNRNVRIMGILILIYGALGFGWHFAPMHQREVLAAGGGTISDTMHIVFSFVTVSLMFVAMSFGAAAFDRNFRLYSIISIIALTIFGILTGIEAPNIDLNAPTPMIGVWERINIGVFLLWVIILAVVLIKRRD